MPVIENGAATVVYAISPGESWEWNSDPIPRTSFGDPFRGTKWHINWMGFRIGDQLYRSIVSYEVAIPYWMPVLTLTLLSAWLILLPNRRARPIANASPLPDSRNDGSPTTALSSG